MSHVEAAIYQSQRQPTTNKHRAYANMPNSPSFAKGSGCSRPRLGDRSCTGPAACGHSRANWGGFNKDGPYKSALPVGLADPSKHPDNASMRHQIWGRLGGVNGCFAAVDDPYLVRIRPPQAMPLHPAHLTRRSRYWSRKALVLVYTDAHQDLVTSELNAIYTNIQDPDLRHKYMRLSLQGHRTIREMIRWNIYPPTPEPVWHGTRSGKPQRRTAA